VHDGEARQAKANADYLRKLLAARRGGAAGFVKPVLMLPGWWVEDSRAVPKAIWVMGNGTLHQWLKKEPGRLSAAEAAGLAEELGNYVRNFGK
jgi:hypothetical protein